MAAEINLSLRGNKCIRFEIAACTSHHNILGKQRAEIISEHALYIKFKMQNSKFKSSQVAPLLLCLRARRIYRDFCANSL